MVYIVQFFTIVGGGGGEQDKILDVINIDKGALLQLL
jgi:hypothetical protein